MIIDLLISLVIMATLVGVAVWRYPLPYLIGLVTAANIGSLATITDNP